ncbi:MAG: 3-hydroxyacyl-CoA dehydrogenase family protein [Bacteroidia bacterium]|jgi:3-hydroxybutyryl-CoA dehydrogenase|nr:3-hydroxyacyl-CoA dehydrogenase family protein [Bacteroidia bacterium]
MKILLIGEKIKTTELAGTFSSEQHLISEIQDTDLSTIHLDEFDCIFDLSFEDHVERISLYASLTDKPVFVSAAQLQLAAVVLNIKQSVSCVLIGLNALPSFLNLPMLEVSLANPDQQQLLHDTMDQLNRNYKLVQDRVGLVTPRIICMIINEACYTLQEGTATIEAIDTSMKLGTNYPYGPFEWADKIGIKHVYHILKAIQLDTNEERYRICPLLKTAYLKGTSFY